MRQFMIFLLLYIYIVHCTFYSSCSVAQWPEKVIPTLITHPHTDSDDAPTLTRPPPRVRSLGHEWDSVVDINTPVSPPSTLLSPYSLVPLYIPISTADRRHRLWPAACTYPRPRSSETHSSWPATPPTIRVSYARIPVNR
jgi:hypothetical protein